MKPQGKAHYRVHNSPSMVFTQGQTIPDKLLYNSFEYSTPSSFSVPLPRRYSVKIRGLSWFIQTQAERSVHIILPIFYTFK